MDTNHPQQTNSSLSPLPLQIIDHHSEQESVSQKKSRSRQWWVFFILASLSAGTIFFFFTNSSKDSNLSIEPEKTAASTLQNHITALGRLAPSSDLRTLAAPFGTSDARIQKILVVEGQQVKAGTPLALFDNETTLQSALAVAEKQLDSRRAALIQAERTVTANQAEAAATVSRLEASAKLAQAEYQRWLALVDKGFVSIAAIDQKKTLRDEAQEELRRARANLARHAGDTASQPDLIVAREALHTAIAERERAEKDLARSILLAPTDGTVIAIHARPGERPGNSGILDFGDVSSMKAELEIYQADLARITIGQPVTMRSPALSEPLTGQITRIRMSVGRQKITDTSPAANIDARIVLATVDLDDASSKRAANLLGLEVYADIDISKGNP